MSRPTPTGVERTFAESKFIVSKTDTRGRITYANPLFRDVAGYTEAELLGKPHSLIRHPDMPMAVFKLLWDRVEAGEEVFAYVVNLAKNGDHYWVLAHVTPTFGPDGDIVGYHSNRRLPTRSAIDTAASLYADLRAEELRHASKREGLEASTDLLHKTLTDLGSTYDALFWKLARGSQRAA